MSENEVITPGKYVEMGYDLYEIQPDGAEKLVHQTDPEDPERIVFGVTQGVIAPLEKAIEGLKAGDEFNVTVESKDAFGPRDEEQIVTLDREVFLVDGKFDDEHIRKGLYVPMMTADGFRINGLVTEVTPEHVRMDFNHPLAGKDVRFKGRVILVRDATPEEIKPAGGCGCGGGCNCDDSCGCDSNGGGGCGCGC